MTKVETPPMLEGTTEEQLQQIRSYLYRLAEAINMDVGSSMLTVGNAVVTDTQLNALLKLI